MKFKSVDQRFKKARTEFSEKYGERELWSVIDQWGLYTGTRTLGRNLAIIDLLKSTLSVPGHVAEFGCWRGATSMLLMKCLRLWDPHGPKVLHAFDSFEGLTAFTPADGDADQTAGQYKGSIEEFQDAISLFDMQDEIHIHEGLIEHTLGPFLEANPELSFSFVYCDTDLYASTALIVEHLHPRLMPGGLFAFDQWNYDNFPGEGVAANEFLAEHGDAYRVESVVGTNQPSLILRKRGNPSEA